MARLVDRLPWYAWLATGVLAVVAGGVFFIPQSVVMALGLSFQQFLIVIALIELGAAIGIGAIVVHYRKPESEREESEWRFDP
jgi:amino acid transporter